MCVCVCVCVCKYITHFFGKRILRNGVELQPCTCPRFSGFLLTWSH